MTSRSSEKDVIPSLGSDYATTRLSSPIKTIIETSCPASDEENQRTHEPYRRWSMSHHSTPRILPCGETALSIEFGNAIDPWTHRRVHALARALRTANLRGILELSPTYRSLLVQYDPWELSHEMLLLQIEESLASAVDEGGPEPDIIEIPVCYGADLGPDLEEVASMHGMTPSEIAVLHAAPVYDVVMVGFTPGFPYLSGLDPRLATPRKEKPRLIVPAGSVGLADGQTGIYSIDSPGGWRIIGRTPLGIFDLHRTDPFLLKPGDRLRFTPITRERFDSLTHP
jgi:KipI family sensor histidine kinase inhibitor